MLLPRTKLDSLHLIKAAVLLAFCRSTTDRAPISPCSAVTLELLAWLEHEGLVVLEPDRQSGLPGSGPNWRWSSMMVRPPLPPFTLETATQKVRLAEDA